MKAYKDLTPVFVHGIECSCEGNERHCDGYETLPTKDEYQTLVAAYEAGDVDATPILGWNIGAKESLEFLDALS